MHHLKQVKILQRSWTILVFQEQTGCLQPVYCTLYKYVPTGFSEVRHKVSALIDLFDMINAAETAYNNNHMSRQRLQFGTKCSKLKILLSRSEWECESLWSAVTELAAKVNGTVGAAWPCRPAASAKNQARYSVSWLTLIPLIFWNTALL